jgi:ubiquinone/menaquinone biosynthesis C-methylase UbiE
VLPDTTNLNTEGYDRYEAFMGRWSRHVAVQFLDWLEVSDGVDWLDVGCGAGMLCQIVHLKCAPASVTGVDPLESSIGHAMAHDDNVGISFKVGDAQELPFENNAFGAVVSGLMMKFVPNKLLAIREMKRVARPGSQVALYDWDMERNRNMTRHFWQAVADVAPDLIEGRATDRPPMNEAGTVADKFREAGLDLVEKENFAFTAEFTDFDDYWYPITHNGQNVGRFWQTLTDDRRLAVHDRIREILPIAADGSITFESQASAVKGRV